jgi:hypothetical protein
MCNTCLRSAKEIEPVGGFPEAALNWSSRLDNHLDVESGHHSVATVANVAERLK